MFSVQKNAKNTALFLVGNGAVFLLCLSIK